MAGNALDYAALASAGTEKYLFPALRHLDYPEGEETQWYGYRRHDFVLDGYSGFIVEPPYPAAGLPWCWCLQWAHAFVPRTPALQLLERGFHHVHLDVFPTYMNDEGIGKLEKFYALLQKLGFHKKAALFGMSYGGLFSLRWAAEHPETVGVIWLDAPVCNLGFTADPVNACSEAFYARERPRHLKAYGVSSVQELIDHPKNPLNNFRPIAEAGIPILAIRSGQDQTILPETNIDVLEKRLLAAGGNIQVIRRDAYGHHPHGMDDPSGLTGFILRHYPGF